MNISSSLKSDQAGSSLVGFYIAKYRGESMWQASEIRR
jgi:hypothetical protein